MGGGCWLAPGRQSPYRFATCRAERGIWAREGTALPLRYVPLRLINHGKNRGSGGHRRHFLSPNCLIFEQIEVTALPLI